MEMQSLAKSYDAGKRVIALPWWGEALEDARAADALPPLPNLRWICARASGHRANALDWRRHLLSAAALPAELLDSRPGGVAVRAVLASLDDMSQRSLPTIGTFAVAQPVHLAAAIDHLRLAPPEQLQLTDGEADELLASLRTWLVDTGCSLWQVRPDLWLWHSADILDCSGPEPMYAVGRNVREFQLSGPSAPRLQCLITELQMALHGHPVNQTRARAGKPVVNSVWLWGFGTTNAAPDRSLDAQWSGRLPALATDDPWLAGVWRLHGQATGALFHAAAAARSAQLCAAWRPPVSGGSAAMQYIDQQWFGPLREAILNRQPGSVHLQLGVQELSVEPGYPWRFWRRGAALTGICE